MNRRGNCVEHAGEHKGMISIFEWCGSVLGLLGAFLLATHTQFSEYGWIAFFLANLAMIAFAFGIRRYGLLVQQIGFVATSVLALYRAGFFSSLL
jgi:hypothetical protein